MPFDPRLEDIIGYFELTVRAGYHAESDKYEIDTDHFEGELDISGEYYSQLSEDQYEVEKVRVRFGYRTLKNGDLKIAAFLPDFRDCAEAHVHRWAAFQVRSADWMDYEQDARFSMWVRRYLEADWGVDNGPADRLVATVQLLNGLSNEAVGCDLYSLDEPEIEFPWAQNTHRYEEAHAALYKVLLDGLNRDCIEGLAARVRISFIEFRASPSRRDEL
jgi:hypothetical protein